MTGLIADAGAFIAGGFGLVILGLVLATSVFVIWMLIDAITSNLPPMEKLIWVLVILFLHVVGALIYFFVGRPAARGTVT